MVSATRDNPPIPTPNRLYECPELSLRARKLGCLTSASRVTLAGGTTFLHINTLARLNGRLNCRHGECQEMPGFKAEICIKEVKINFAKPTVIE